MIPGIRLATQEEVEKIKDKADLTPTSAVWTWPNEKGEPDIGVIRQCWEVDPVIFGATSGAQRKALFFWALTNMMRVVGPKEIYFDVDAEGTEDYVAILEKMGAEKTTLKPQYRFKLPL